jgi:hypothetical protein
MPRFLYPEERQKDLKRQSQKQKQQSAKQQSLPAR